MFEGLARFGFRIVVSSGFMRRKIASPIHSNDLNVHSNDLNGNMPDEVFWRNPFQEHAGCAP